MKKTLYCILIVAIALIVVSCGDKELTSINPGLYEIEYNVKYEGQLIAMKEKVRYRPEGTYEATNFQSNVAVEELKGKFKVENKQLFSFDSYYRPITGEGTWKPKEPKSVAVRKIKKGSYQFYFKFPSDQTREQYEKLGLSEGWKTYTRIGD